MVEVHRTENSIQQKVTDDIFSHPHFPYTTYP